MPLPLRGVNGRAFLRVLFPRAPVPRAFGEAPEKAGTHAAGGTVASRLIVPLGLAISCLAHVAFLGPALLLSGSPFDAPQADAITVDIVPSEEVPQSTSEPAAPEPASQAAAGNPSPSPAAPSQSTSQAAPQSPAPAPSAPPQPAPPPPRPARPDVSKQAAGTAAATLPLPPPPFTPQTQMPPTPPDPPPVAPGDPASVFAMPLTMPDGSMGGRTFDSQAVDRADVENDVVTAFRSHLKTCSKLPAGVAPQVKVVVRLYLKPDGSLAAGLPANPEMIRVDGMSSGGGLLWNSVRAALSKCQPYRMLPADRYPEWKMLDITFTPQNF